MTLQNLFAAQLLPSKAGRRILCTNLLSLTAFMANIDGYDLNRIFSLLLAIFNNKSDRVIWNHVTIAVIELTFLPRSLLNLNQTPYLCNTSSFINISKQRKYIDGVLKAKLGLCIHIRVSHFYKGFFREIEGLETVTTIVFINCQKGNNLVYNQELS